MSLDATTLMFLGSITTAGIGGITAFWKAYTAREKTREEREITAEAARVARGETMLKQTRDDATVLANALTLSTEAMKDHTQVMRDLARDVLPLLDELRDRRAKETKP